MNHLIYIISAVRIASGVVPGVYNSDAMDILENILTHKKASISTVLVLPKENSFDPDRSGVLQDIRDHGITSLQDVRTGKLFLLENLPDEAILRLQQDLFVELTHQIGAVNSIPTSLPKPDFTLAVSYLPGVTNPEVESIKHAAMNLGVKLDLASTARIYFFYGRISENQKNAIRSMFINKTVEYELIQIPQTLAIGQQKDISVETIPIRDMSNEDLGSLSAMRSLFLTGEEMRVIRDYFREIGRDPMDCELEIFAQVWSEHCGHKTFKADVLMNGKRKESFFSRIKKVTNDIAHSDVWSAFHDNAGVVMFEKGRAAASAADGRNISAGDQSNRAVGDESGGEMRGEWAGDEIGLCIKGETHNAPSAIEPFGGAETGVGGVIRDILGTGRGAKPVGVFDVLCFGNPEIPQEKVPEGCLHPSVMLRKVVAGIQGYGNKIGLPNVSGALFFDDCYMPKPVVLAGSIGLISKKNVMKETPKDGDAILCIGGKTGRDGIHGATFSSGAMETSTRDVQSQAVQIGYPALEKRVMDVLAVLREKNLIRIITDCGAGGFSSAVTEMAAEIGAEIDLSKVSLKYQGLSPWEIFLSESQERMMIGVRDRDAPEIQEICRRYGVNCDCLGFFRDNGKKLKVSYGEIFVAELSLPFLFENNPVQIIEGAFQEPEFDTAAVPELSKDGLRDYILRVLSHLNVCSREPIIRRYDHYVRTGNYLSYFEGRHRDTPQDAMVFKPLFDSDRGFSVSHGMHPNIAAIDPYYSAQASVIEAISNVLCRGANLNKIFLMDNFIHAKPDNKEDVGTLDREVDGLCAAAKMFGTPFVSGKDSLGGTYRGSNLTIKVKPTLCVTALGIIDDVKKAPANHFQHSGSRLLFVGGADFLQLGGSIFFQIHAFSTNNIPRPDLEKTRKIFQAVAHAISDRKILSCHDVSDGGLITTLAEMSLGEGIGCEINLDCFRAPVAGTLFHETPGCFALEVSRDFDAQEYFKEILDCVYEIGHVRKDDSFVILKHATAIFSASVNELRGFLKNPLLEKYFPTGSRDLQTMTAKIPDSRSPLARVSIVNKPRVLVLRAPAINSEEETSYSFGLVGAKSRIVDIADLSEKDFDESQILVVPGGFSYADDIASGKIMATDLMYFFQEQLAKFASSDKLILGICNGFQVLVRIGLLPFNKIGTLDANLIYNEHGFFCRKIRLQIVPSCCVWTRSLSEAVFTVPVAHGEGRFITKEPSLLRELARNEQIVFRYVDDESRATMKFPYNPNGAFDAIAGVCDPSGRILGMMPHPERDARNLVQQTFTSFIGLEILRNGVRYFR